MKIYGVTTVLPNGGAIVTTDNGAIDIVSARSQVFAKEDEALTYALNQLQGAYKCFTFGAYGEHPALEDYETELKEQKHVRVQGATAWADIVMFTQELAIDRIEAETPAGKLIAEVHGTKDDHPGIWVQIDTSYDPFNIIGAVEYDTANERLQTVSYISGTDEPVSIIDYATGNDFA